jgi:putative transposase
MRYIELNPVRANMVQDLGLYRWSSYRHNGLGQPDTLITPHPVYLSIDRDEAQRQSSYRTLFRSQLDDEALADIRLALAQGHPLDGDRFSDKICLAAGIRHTQKVRGRPAEKPDQAGVAEAQNEFGF